VTIENETMIPGFLRIYPDGIDGIPVSFFLNFSDVSTGVVYVTHHNLSKVLGIDLLVDVNAEEPSQGNVLTYEMGTVETINGNQYMLFNEYEIIAISEKVNSNIARWFISVFSLHRHVGNFWKVGIKKEERLVFYAAAGVEG
jgi:hypothetical protein